MRFHQISSLFIRWFGGFLVFFSSLTVISAQSPTAPTASEAPAEIDHIWQRASSKYDAERFASTAGSQSVQSVSLLGSDERPKFQQGPDGWHVQLPAPPPAKYAYVLQLTF